MSVVAVYVCFEAHSQPEHAVCRINKSWMDARGATITLPAKDVSGKKVWITAGLFNHPNDRDSRVAVFKTPQEAFAVAEMVRGELSATVFEKNVAKFAYLTQPLNKTERDQEEIKRMDREAREAAIAARVAAERAEREKTAWAGDW